jgi:hypothetical protein
MTCQWAAYMLDASPAHALVPGKSLALTETSCRSYSAGKDMLLLPGTAQRGTSAIGRRARSVVTPSAIGRLRSISRWSPFSVFWAVLKKALVGKYFLFSLFASKVVPACSAHRPRHHQCRVLRTASIQLGAQQVHTAMSLVLAAAAEGLAQRAKLGGSRRSARQRAAAQSASS